MKLTYAAMKTALEIGAIPAVYWKDPRFVTLAVARLDSINDRAFRERYRLRALSQEMKAEISRIYVQRLARSDCRPPEDLTAVLKEELKVLREATQLKRKLREAGFLEGINVAMDFTAHPWRNSLTINTCVVRDKTGALVPIVTFSAPPIAFVAYAGETPIFVVPTFTEANSCKLYRALGGLRYLEAASLLDSGTDAWAVALAAQNCAVVDPVPALIA